MDSIEKKIYKDYFLNNEEWYTEKMKLLDKKVKTYENRFMSNTKWKKLFLTIFSNVDVIKQCEIVVLTISEIIDKTIVWTNNVELTRSIDEVNKYLFDDYIDTYLAGGHNPISYREIEYLEFKKYNYQWIGTAVLKKEILQNTNDIKVLISKTGQFHWKETEEYIRIYGYK